MKVISNLINSTKELYSLQKIIRHLDIALDKTNQDPIILIEKEYIEKTSKVFFNKLINKLNKEYPLSEVIEYAVNQDLKKISYFAKKKPLSKSKINELFNSYSKFIDFIQTGRAFYKDSPLKFGVILVRLSNKNAQLFGYNKLMTILLDKKSLITSQYLEQINNFNIDELNIKIPPRSYFYLGAGTFYKNNSKYNFRVLPIDTITGFLKNPNSALKKSNIVLDGVIKKYGYIEDINKKLNLKGDIFISIKKNKIDDLKINSKTIKLDKSHKIVHLTFGSNPFIPDNNLQITDYERSHNYLCIGIEDANKSHIDICLNVKPIKSLSLIIFWIEQKLKKLIN